MELQKRDTLLRAREQKDAIVSSLRQRHESELSSYKEELDEVTKQRNQLERKLDDYRARLDERERAHDRALADKCQQVDGLEQRLSDAQRRLAQAAAASGGGRASEQAEQLGRSGPSSLEEICQLRAALSEATHAREEQERRIRDLSVRSGFWWEVLHSVRTEANSISLGKK